ncbi:hypothetical protein EJ05DRAFT_509642 [Pseudovirgaria hyperparasitica]|uniref:RED-like N-terminal domain-containing protein n=1 Tax=Pseudovirgaria hyperparasitica TaxID=470096 RepID=A0A6A6WBB7_9PEZI|nr:uncharacterized protein EJ05DRAFT_509642 [Pseudovirgaria hyperparasitica]KAF2759973.1 hypothetical protein EJ05DRAFT_509642 [Pseudovirgaria hyperparasitica]
MNNSQFRKLVLEQSTSKPENGTQTTPQPSATPFGARARGFMTPRHTPGSTNNDFRRQLFEQAAENQQRKKFRSSAAPKGTKLAAGYSDRTQSRKDEEDDDKGKRIKALEESMKLQQIDQATFEKLRDQITGGDISSTHLVKGLDRKLLERIKRGEDVMNSPSKEQDPEEDIVEDLDGALDEFQDKSVAPIQRQRSLKRGEMAPPATGGIKRDRNALLAELRASRQAATETKAAASSKFRRIGEKREESRFETDARGREVLIVTDAEGNVKRKVRKVKADPNEPEVKASVLGTDVVMPEQPVPSPVKEEEEEDMFADAGTDYNPFGVVVDEGDSSEEEDGELEASTQSKPSQGLERLQTQASIPSPKATDTVPQAKRKYFDDEPEVTPETSFNPLHDPAILAALRNSREDGKKPKLSQEEEARQKKHAAMLASSNRDFEDMDMGFGSSRLADEEEMEGGDHIKLSEWGRDGDADGAERGGTKRKRGPKKKRGDKNNATDIMKAMEGQKGK